MNIDRTDRTSPTAPDLTSASVFTIWGWNLYMKSFHQKNSGFRCGFLHLPDLARVQGHGFFAEDVFPGPDRPAGPFAMQVVWKRDIDGIDIRIVEERLIMRIGFRDLELAGPIPAPASGLSRRSP